MKVLHIITRMDTGGSAQNTLLTVKSLSLMKGDEVTLVTGSVKDVDVRDINIVIIPELKRKLNPVADSICLFKLYKYIKKSQFDIVHTHSSKAGFLGRIAAWMAGVPTILYTPHGHIFYGYFNSCITQIFILLEKLAAKFTDKIISLTDSETQDYIKFRIAPKDKFITIHSGIEIDRFTNSHKPRPTSREPTIISVARLVPIKGHKYLIEAASKVANSIPNVRFLLVGGGALRKGLEEQVQHLNIKDNVLFLGERQDVPELLRHADIFVLSSLNEGMGRAIVEAMVAGLPVVATNVCGIRDVVVDGKTGILVPSHDPSAMAKAIIMLLQDPELREKMGAAGKERAKEKFAVDTMIEKIVKLYQELKGN